jgi:anhydro-N-acetylmuramic acid kinase
MDSKQQYKVIGLMSGTSLDGVDIACCTFSEANGWHFVIEEADTIRYTAKWIKKLNDSHQVSGEKLLALDIEYGKFLGSLCLEFIRKHKIKNIDFISSHGHTMFHQPDKGFTFQLGNGNALHAIMGLPVVYDFRSLDVLNGGQGAPLVPIGDKLLFGEYDVCLNLGGIANVSMDGKKVREAFDVCFVNMGLNYLAAKAGKKFDPQGKLSESGEVNAKLLQQLDRVYSKIRKVRPSLGREFFEKHIQPLLNQENISLRDRLRTFTESAAKEVSLSIVKPERHHTVLCTGGGVFNTFFIYRLIELCGDDATLVIPEDEIVNFKEALVFAFLGVLRVQGKVNCLKSVTGAKKDSSGGVMVGF